MLLISQFVSFALSKYFKHHWFWSKENKTFNTSFDRREEWQPMWSSKEVPWIFISFGGDHKERVSQVLLAAKAVRQNNCIEWKICVSWVIWLWSRQVETNVELSLGLVTGLQVMLLYRWPRGVYLDPYQIANLHDQNNWQVCKRKSE